MNNPKVSHIHYIITCFIDFSKGIQQNSLQALSQGCAAEAGGVLCEQGLCLPNGANYSGKAIWLHYWRGKSWLFAEIERIEKEGSVNVVEGFLLLEKKKNCAN